jgi:acetate kinase
MKILVINAGSSSIKYKLYALPQQVELAQGLVERIGEAESRIAHTAGEQSVQRRMSIPNHKFGLQKVAELLLDPHAGIIRSPAEIAAIGHRVVHGGEQFAQPTLINERVKTVIRDLSSLAPLHNPPNLLGIEVAERIFPAAAQVAVFDTAFHQTLPPYAFRYALPQSYYEQDSVRVYGFHGTSHHYVSRQAIAHLQKPAGQTNLITLHLGNGASICAVQGGRSMDTSMGFSPLAGLVMGTRSGDLDPAVVFYLGRKHGLDMDQIDHLLNKQSGLLGLAGNNDLRDLQRRQEDGDPAARLALEIYCYRIQKYIGAYLAVLGGLDALVFTAGVGENSATIRRQICSGLAHLGIILDEERNDAGLSGPVSEIQAAAGRVKLFVIPTNEELEIATQTYTLLAQIS